MALTRAFLKGLGIDEDKATSIIEAHSETVTGLNNKYADLEKKFNAAKADSDKLADVQRELDGYKKDDYKGKYERLFDSVEKGKTRAAKESAVKAYYEEKNIKGGNLAIALRGTDIDSLELDEDGKLKSTDALDSLIDGDFKPLIGSARRTVSSGGNLNGNRQGSEQNANETMNRLIRGG